MNKKRIEEEKKKILIHYNNLYENLRISLISSILGGLISAILIAIILGQKPAEVYQRFTFALILWATTLVILFLLFFFLLWLFIVFVPKKKALKRVESSSTNNMKKGNLGLFGWILIITSIILLIFFLSQGKYNFALSFAITMFLFITLMWTLRLNLNEEDYNKVERKIELNKLRLHKYETLSIALISIGVGIFVAGLYSGNIIENMNTWISLGMIIVGVLIEKFHVETRYKILEDFYEKNEKEKIR